MKIRNLMITAAACLLLTGIPAYAQEDGTTLTQIGTIDDPDGTITQTYGIICRSENGSEEPCSFDGTPVSISDQWSATTLIDDSAGVYVVTIPGTDLSKCGLMKSDGTMLIEPDPAIIQEISDSRRFVKVMYGEETTTNEDEAIFYVSSSLFSLNPSDEDTLYKGHWKIYDLQEEQFVEPLSFTSSSVDVKICGDETIWVQEPDKDAVLYSADGTVISDTVKVYPQGAYFIVDQNGMSIVYNSNLERLFETNLSPSGSASLGEYLKYYDNNKDTLPYGLMDAQGNIVLNAAYDSIFEVTSSGYVEVAMRDADGNYLHGLVKPDGTEVVPCEYDSIYDYPYGYVGCEKRKDDGTVELIFVGPNGTVSSTFEGSSLSASNLFFGKEDGAGTLAYVVNDGDYTLKLNDSDPRILLSTMVRDEDPVSGKYALYDLVTGEQLLDYEYGHIFSAYGYIYAYKDGVYTIYQAD